MEKQIYFNKEKLDTLQFISPTVNNSFLREEVGEGKDWGRERVFLNTVISHEQMMQKELKRMFGKELCT